MLHDESHELFLSLSGSCEIRRLRSSRTAIWEVCGIAAAVDFTNIPSCMLHTVLSVLPGDSHPGTGVYIEPRTFCVICFMLTQVFCTGDSAADGAQRPKSAELVCNEIQHIYRAVPEIHDPL